ncbi:hypothetical protein KY330_05840 [Candidatus Woesearchaeota archaeon]|nr:hypothetical protein [Candidatus Woesearchaeota archaeon]
MNLALNPFDKGRKPESIDKVVLDNDPIIFEALDYLNNLQHSRLGYYEHEQLKKKVVEYQCTPAQINVIMRLALDSEDIVNNGLVSWLVSRLIQTSYNNGHNDFTLPGSDIKLLCKELEGKAGNLIKISAPKVGHDYAVNSVYISSVIGEAKSFCYCNAGYAEITINKAGMLLGNGAQGCVFTVLEDVGDLAGWHSNDCTFRSNKRDIIRKLEKQMRFWKNEFSIESF